MDFGMAVRHTSDDGTVLRYFRPVGKDYYRAPECYVPLTTQAAVVVPQGARPGDIIMTPVAGKSFCEVRLPANAEPKKACMAEVWGYAAAPADVWSVGVCILIMLVGSPAWGKAMASDRFFVYARQHGVTTLLQRCKKPALPAAAQELVYAALRSMST